MNTLEFTTQLAQETGEILLSFYQRSGIRSKNKPDRTVVTEADLAADQHLHSRISKNYPDDGILSEEAGTTFPAGKSAVWIIDPLDGTTNFIHNLPVFSISIALIHKNELQLGVINDVAQKE